MLQDTAEPTIETVETEAGAAAPQTAILPYSTVERIVAARESGLAMFREAIDAIAVASKKVAAAHAIIATVAPSTHGNGLVDPHATEISAFYNAVKMPDRDQYLRTATHLTDLRLWAYIVETTELERLMDVQAKKQLAADMAYVPEQRRGDELVAPGQLRGLPPVTVENVQATLERFVADAGTIFRRGIANAFSRLDRRFRSHDGFKIGSRVILSRAFDERGSWLYNSWHRETLMDIERVFAVLDGKKIGASYASAIGAIDADRRGFGGGPRQSETKTDYFEVRIFKNGNAHLWFRRKDLLSKVNLLLAEHYGETIGDGMTQEADPLATPKTSLAKNYGFFPTPDAAADRAVGAAELYRDQGDPQLRVLEPSAGTGNLAARCATPRTGTKWNRAGADSTQDEWTYQAAVECVEIQASLAAGLQATGRYARVYNQDFLTLQPETTGLFDRVVMNPPFDRERDIDHVVHALRFLKPDGVLVAIMSAGTEHRETKKSIAFREKIEAMGGGFEELPAGSFSTVGTNINTVVLKVCANGRRLERWHFGR